jgi:hypothetical protein
MCWNRERIRGADKRNSNEPEKNRNFTQKS